MKRQVTLTLTCEVEFDESLLPDDGWRQQFYPIHNADDLAGHLAYNAVVNGLCLSQMDGFADREDSLLSINVVDCEVE